MNPAINHEECGKSSLYGLKGRSPERQTGCEISLGPSFTPTNWLSSEEHLSSCRLMLRGKQAHDMLAFWESTWLELCTHAFPNNAHGSLGLPALLDCTHTCFQQ